MTIAPDVTDRKGTAMAQWAEVRTRGDAPDTSSRPTVMLCKRDWFFVGRYPNMADGYGRTILPGRSARALPKTLPL